MARTFSNETLLEVDTAAMEQLMAAIRGGAVTPADMRSRLREFQKRFFPKAASVGRGKRTLYGLGEVLEIAIAFELADLDLSTPRCIAIVEHNRRVLARVCAAAWERLRGAMAPATTFEPVPTTASSDFLMHVAPTGITHDRGGYVAFGSLEQAATMGSPLRHSRLTLDLMMLAADIASVLIGDRFRYKEVELDRAFASWAADVGKLGDWTAGELLIRDHRVAR